MNLKATFEAIKVFNVEINGKSIGLFQQVSDWNGLVELSSLRTPSNSIIAWPCDRTTHMAKMFAEVIGGAEPKAETFQIVMCSPDIVLAGSVEKTGAA
ncbi:MAG: hypothetical protein ACOVOD_04140 [Rhodoferax sp.]|jgi:hypothetical protein